MIVPALTSRVSDVSAMMLPTIGTTPDKAILVALMAVASAEPEITPVMLMYPVNTYSTVFKDQEVNHFRNFFKLDNRSLFNA